MIQTLQAQNRAAMAFHNTQLGGFSPVTSLLLAVMTCFSAKPRIQNTQSMRAAGSGLLAGGGDSKIQPVVNKTHRLECILFRPLEFLFNL